MTTTITLSSFQAAMVECADAIDAGNYNTARTKLAKAGAILAGMPKDVADSNQRMTMREDLNKLEELITKVEASGGAATDDERRMISTKLGFCR